MGSLQAMVSLVHIHCNQQQRNQGKYPVHRPTWFDHFLHLLAFQIVYFIGKRETALSAKGHKQLDPRAALKTELETGLAYA